MLYAIYVSLPGFQRMHLEEMGLAMLLSILPFWVDVALLQALRERCDSSYNAFVMPWGHMTPTLEDVARLTGLRVHGDPVTGTTQGDCRQLTRRALGYEDRGLLPLRTLRGSALTTLLGIKGVVKRPNESYDAYIERMGQAVAERWMQTEGKEARRELRIFLFFFLGRVLFATKGSSVRLRFLTCLEDLSAVGSYAWGAAMLAHLFYHIPRGKGETSVSGFSPFLQVCSSFEIAILKLCHI